MIRSTLHILAKKILSRYSWLPISIIAGIIALSCADPGPYYPSSFFAPEIIHNKAVVPFFVSGNDLYGNPYKEDYATDFNEININEWAAYFNGKVTRADLKYMLYTAGTGEIDTLIFAVKKHDFPISHSLKNNSILGVQDKKKATDFLYYIGYAKRCEPHVTRSPYWYYDTYQDDIDSAELEHDCDLLEAGGIKQLSNASSDFVKQRYVFQVLRLYLISANPEECIALYNQQVKLIKSIHNSMQYRCMGYFAGALYKEKNYAEANYLYSIIFKECETMKVSAYFSFHPQEEQDWNKTLSMAKNNEEKITLWELLGMRHDPLRAMKQIYAIDPQSEAMNLLLVRAINLAEDTIILADQNGEFEDIKLYNNNTDPELVSFVKNVADKENTNKPYVWNLAAGYLSWVRYNTGYDAYLAKAIKESGRDSLVVDEARLINILSEIESVKVPDKKFEDKIAPELLWLQYGKHASFFRNYIACEYIVQRLSAMYKTTNNVYYRCFTGFKIDHDWNSDLRATQDNNLLDSILKIMNNPKSPMDIYAVSILGYTKKDLIDLQVVNLIYEYRFKDASSKLSQPINLPEDTLLKNPNNCYYCYYKHSTNILNADPFMIHIRDNHDSDANVKHTVYTKSAFAQKMAELEDKVKSDPKNAADYYFQLANGYYNMTYFGNSRVLYSTASDEIGCCLQYYSEAMLYPQPDLIPYLTCKKAEDCYQKAMDLSNNPDFRAKCCFMAAKCEQNNYISQKGFPDYYNYDHYRDTIRVHEPFQYFKQLKNNYSSTKYYAEVLNECGYFRFYVKNHD